MEDFDINNEEMEHGDDYFPSEYPTLEDIPRPSDDYIPLDDSVTIGEVAETVSAEIGISDIDIDETLSKPISSEEETKKYEDSKEETMLGRKCCPTRHGCQGATDCDYAYGSYPF